MPIGHISHVVSAFQSLIGRLQTNVCFTGAVIQGGFQSLIGRLQTFVSASSVVDDGGVQSLIGRLQTVGGVYRIYAR